VAGREGGHDQDDFTMNSPKKDRQRGRCRTLATNGDFGLAVLEAGSVAAAEIAAARRAATRRLGRGKMWIRIRVGAAASEGRRLDVTPGRILFEVRGVREVLARQVMQLAARNLGIQTQFVTLRPRPAQDVTGEALRGEVGKENVTDGNTRAALNRRRVELIKKKATAGLSVAEQDQLDALQRAMRSYVDRIAPLPRAVLPPVTSSVGGSRGGDAAEPGS
jgi:large subunit ribosomal protein L16